MRRKLIAFIFLIVKLDDYPRGSDVSEKYLWYRTKSIYLFCLWKIILIKNDKIGDMLTAQSKSNGKNEELKEVGSFAWKIILQGWHWVRCLFWNCKFAMVSNLFYFDFCYVWWNDLHWWNWMIKEIVLL